jgi:CubicO group peptidase (beta-lactamase class C family)
MIPTRHETTVRSLVKLGSLILVGSTIFAVLGCVAPAADDVKQMASIGTSASLETTGSTYPDEEWIWVDRPESLGWSSEKLSVAQTFSRTIGTAAVMIVVDGVVVDAWGDLTTNYPCHSMRKSLMSALYGIYVGEGAIDITRTLADLGIMESLTTLTQTESQSTVADLLKARSGVYIRAAGEAREMVEMRPERGSHAPGTFWYYNNWDFNALGTIFDQESGVDSIYAAFQERIAEPIGMQDFHPEEHAYSYEFFSMHPYYGFNVSTRDLARLGLLFLREGCWKDAQIVPADWVAESTSPHSEIGPESGYGYMWWTGSGAGLFPNVRVAKRCYYASGYGGHRVVVLPYLDLVIVHRVNTFEYEDEVTPAEFGVLLWRILDAAGETDIGDPPYIECAPGELLVADDLQAMIAGAHLRSVGGSTQADALFDGDGTLRIFVDGVQIIEGTWSIEGSELSVLAPELDTGGPLKAVQDGSILRFFEQSGILSNTFEIVGEDR